MSPKLLNKYIEPYYVTLALPNKTYKLNLVENNKPMKALVHVNRLKKFNDPADRLIQNNLNERNTAISDSISQSESTAKPSREETTWTEVQDSKMEGANTKWFGRIKIILRNGLQGLTYRTN